MGKVGLCLAGGGAKGVVQYGMLKAWRELGLNYDALYGTSVGALNGALLHGNDWDDLDKLWHTVRNKDVYKLPWYDPLRMFSKRASLYDSGPLGKLIRKLISYENVKANPKDFWFNTTNMDTWAAEAWEVDMFPDAESFYTHLHASASPPNLFQPIRYKGVTLVDGGLRNNFCLAQAVKDGCDTIITFNFATPDPHPINNAKDAFDNMLGVMMYSNYPLEKDAIEIRNRIVREGNEQPAMREIRVIEVQPESPVGFGLLDFNYDDREALIALGYKSAMNKLKDVCLD